MGFSQRELVKVTGVSEECPPSAASRCRMNCTRASTRSKTRKSLQSSDARPPRVNQTADTHEHRRRAHFAHAQASTNHRDRPRRITSGKAEPFATLRHQGISGARACEKHPSLRVLGTGDISATPMDII